MPLELHSQWEGMRREASSYNREELRQTRPQYYTMIGVKCWRL